MGKRKCTQKQLDALARGRAKRLKKITKAAFQPQFEPSFQPTFQDILALTEKEPIKKKPENKQKKITDFFSIAKKNEINNLPPPPEIAMPPPPEIAMPPPKKETTKNKQKKITDFFSFGKKPSINIPTPKITRPVINTPSPPPPEIAEPKPVKKKRLITDYFNIDYKKKSDYSPKKKEDKEPKKELKQTSIKDFFEADNIKIADNEPKKKNETENKTKKSIKSVQTKITDFFKKLDEANKAKDDELTDQRIAEISKKIREDKPYQQNKTKTIIYNGETLEIPIALLPEDKTFLEKNGNKIKNMAVSAAALGLMGYGAAKGYKYFMKYGAPILEAAIKLIFKTAEIGGKTVETTAKAAKATGKAASNAGSFIGKVGRGIFKAPGAMFNLTKEGTRKLLEAVIL